MLKNTGENPFAQLAYQCDECSFAQHAAIEPPPGWSKAPTQVILPIGELRSTPSSDGVPDSMDFTSPDFEDAGALVDYPRPAGWTYSTRILDVDLVMESSGVVSVLAIRGEAASTWEQR